MCVSPGPDSHPNLLTASLYILPFVHVLIVGTLTIMIFHCITPKMFNQPTKDRAKKPRKVKHVQVPIKEQDKTSAVKLVQGHSQATAKIRSSTSVSTIALEAIESPPTHIPTAIDQLIEAEELSVTNNASFASGWPDTTLTETLPVTASAVSFSPFKRTKRISRIGRSLPDLTSERRAMEPVTVATSPKSSSGKLREDKPMYAAVRHPRVTGAGNRRTAMDVAFAFSQQTENDSANTQIFNPATVIASESKVEKRKSALDKYSSIMLPALKEEATPSASPIGTLSQAAIPPEAARVDNAMIGEKPAESSAHPTVKLPHLSTAR